MAVPTRRDILEPMDCDEEGAELKDLVLKRLLVLLEEGEYSSLPGDIRLSLKKSISVFVAQYVKRYRAAGALDTFLKKEEKWLDSCVWLDERAKFYFKSEFFEESESDDNKEDVDEIGNLYHECDEITLQDDEDIQIGVSENTDSEPEVDRRPRPRPASSKRKRIVYKDDSELSGASEWEDEILAKTAKVPWTPGKRGRPPKNASVSKRGGRGRPRKYSESDDQPKSRFRGRGKRSDIAKSDLESYTSDELLFAASQSAMKDRRPVLRQAIKIAVRVSRHPEKAKELIRQPEELKSFTVDEAVLLNMENDLLSRVYKELRLSAKSRYADIYPVYHDVTNAKFACYPSGIQLTHSVSEVPLQSLLNHTADRILKLNKTKLAQMQPNCRGRYKLILSVKWGFDGSAGSHEWRQRDSREADLFCASLIPLYLKCTEDTVWRNPVPSSVRFCRPLSIQGGKESPELAYEAQVRVESQIRELQPYTTTLYIGEDKKKPKPIHWKIKRKMEAEAAKNKDDPAFNPAADTGKDTPTELCIDIFFHVQHIIIEPSIATPITGTDSSVDCHMCSKPSPFNQQQLNAAALMPSRPVNPESYKHVLSPNHAWVSCFECLTHLACFLPQEYWSTGADVNTRVTQRKAEIQRGFRKELGLIIDRPRTGSTVSVNDTNTARKAFDAVEEFANICGLDKNLVHRFNVILTALSCDHEIDPEEFGIYCQTTAELFKDLYHWFHLPLTVHKLLYHAETMISESILPIGQMSEEAQKARNKVYMPTFIKFGKNERKERGMTDVLQWLMVMGDPIMSTYSLDLRRKKQNWKNLGEVVKVLKNGLSFKENSEHADDPDVIDLDETELEIDNSFEPSDPHVEHHEDPRTSQYQSQTSATAAVVPSSAAAPAHYNPVQHGTGTTFVMPGANVHNRANPSPHPNIMKLALDSLLRF